MIESFKSFLKEKLPPLSKWKLLPKTLKEKELKIFWISLFVFLFSLTVFSFSLFFELTEKNPSTGGSYVEGFVGTPRFINPIYSPASDIDRDIVSLVFSGLIQKTSSRSYVLDLAEEIVDDGFNYQIKLREGLKWSDGHPLTADDLIFTIKTIQDPEYRSPLRPDWIGIRTEKISDLEVNLILEQPSATFINKLDLKIIPGHIWNEVSPQNFSLSRYNLNPISSGPYRIKELKENGNQEIQQIVLEVNPFYHKEKPYIENFSLRFFKDKEEMISSARNQEINGFSIVNPSNYKEVIRETNFQGYRFQIPRYFALFFNVENNLVSDEKLRKALSLSLNKQKIIEEVLSNRAVSIDSIVLPLIYGVDIQLESRFDLDEAKEKIDSLNLVLNEDGVLSKKTREAVSLNFTKNIKSGDQGEEVRKLQKCLIFISESDPEIFQGNITGFYGQDTQEAVTKLQEKYREEILAPGGFSRGTGMVAESTRKKLNELCSEIPEQTEDFVLRIATVNQPLMIETAEEIKRQWGLLGIETEIDVYSRAEIERDVIKPRNYQILLFGKALDLIPDLLPFWHSSQKSEFGLNLTMHSTERIDTLLEILRQEKRKEDRAEVLKEIHREIEIETPAIPLYNPDYLFFVSRNIKGFRPGVIISPSDRFFNVNEWYIKTKRIFKTN